MFDNLAGRKCVLLWSAGLDSTLILSMLRQQGHPFDIVQVRDFWTKEQLKRSDDLIKRWNLKVFSYPPADVSLIGQGDDITAVYEMAVGTARVPMLRDVVEGTRCIADMEPHRMESPPMPWDLWIVGSRKDDRHYAGDTVVPAKSWTVGGVEIFAPLYDWSRASVVAELEKRGLETSPNDGDLEACLNCLNGTGKVWCHKQDDFIDAVVWDREFNLNNFRSIYVTH